MLLYEAKSKISQLSPEFDLKSLKLVGTGTESVAYLANEEWIFRFPNTSALAQKAQEIKRECALLPQLQNVLPISIPQFQYLGNENNQIIYVGYKILPGIPLLKNNFNALDTSKQEQTLKDLAYFIQRLHDFPVKTAHDCGVKEELYKGAYHKSQKSLLDEIRHLLSTEEIAKIETWFNDFEQNTPNESETLLHADLKPEHILYDPETGHITGIIDWGDVCIGDRDYDFVCPYLFYDQNFVRRLLRYFPNLNPEQTLSNIQFFILIRWLQDTALFLKSEDEEFTQFCLESLKKHLLENIL